MLVIGRARAFCAEGEFRGVGGLWLPSDERAPIGFCDVHVTASGPVLGMRGMEMRRRTRRERSAQTAI